MWHEEEVRATGLYLNGQRIRDPSGIDSWSGDLFDGVTEKLWRVPHATNDSKSSCIRDGRGKLCNGFNVRRE